MAKRKPARAQRPPKSAVKSRPQKAKTARSRPARASARKAKKAKKKVGRGPARQSAKKARKAAASTRRTSTKRAAARKSASRPSAAKKKAAKKTVKKTVVRKTAKTTTRTRSRAKHPPTLDRTRRIAAEAETFPALPSSLDLDRHPSAARSGREELRERLHEHTSTGPSMTAGDIDADWEAAESVGDEAPGGDNPTPDQDVVDEIGRALGVEYDDNEELKGGDKIGARDKHRWELDPASSDDYEERE